jgi:hypothetical protein
MCTHSSKQSQPPEIDIQGTINAVHRAQSRETDITGAIALLNQAQSRRVDQDLATRNALLKQELLEYTLPI